jgi:hypothetical protein
VYWIADDYQMATTIFFSWQADTPTGVGRNFTLRNMMHSGQKFIPDIENDLSNSLKFYSDFLEGLGVPRPHKWVAGMEDLANRNLYAPLSWGAMALGSHRKCLAESVIAEGTFSAEMSAKQAIEPFFVKLFDACGMARS